MKNFKNYLKEQTLQEFTIDDFKKEVKTSREKTHKGVLKRSKKLVTKYKETKLVGRRFIITFHTKAATTPNVDHWVQEVNLVDMPEALKLDPQFKKYKLRDLVNLAVFGDIKCRCGCPAFLYWGYKYIMGQLDATIGRKETRIPHIRNPKMEGAVCKHLMSVLNKLPFHISDITKDVRKILRKK